MVDAALALAAYGPMLFEAALSRRHERRLRAAGATEPRDDVFGMMQVVYPLSFAAMLGESFVARRDASLVLWTGLAIFAVAKSLKYWAIATLGVRWTFRVLVPPNSERTIRGPYRFIRHPNYVAVAGELAGYAMMAAAPLAGTLALVVFIALLRARIRVEERALGLR